MTARQHFEKIVGAAPYHMSVERNPDDHSLSAWPGMYKEQAVELAWCMWEEAIKHTVKACAAFKISSQELGGVSELYAEGYANGLDDFADALRARSSVVDTLEK